MKNFYKHLLMLGLFLHVSLGASAAVYSGSCGDNAKWSLDTSTGLLSITGSGKMTDYSFSSDAPWYNYRSSIKSLSIGNQITSIGDYAFYYCSGLTSVTIPNSVTSIGEEAFFHCTSLTSVTIGNSVTEIGRSAFNYCSSLTSVVVESGNTVYDSRDNCNAIIETKSNTLISGFKNTTIPNSVTSIGNGAFFQCSGLTSVTIPNSVTSIGERAFSGCSGLTSVTIGNSVTSIGDYAFYGCSSLTSVTIPNSVTSIGEDAFNHCTGLTSVTIGSSVTSIGRSAFYGCSGLTSVTIPNSVTSIGHQAFNYCRSLSSVVVQSGNAKYDSRNNCNAIIETATNTLIAGSNNTKIPNSVVRITSTAFLGSGVASVEIPASVTTIELGAFKQCESLTNIVVSSGNTKYDSRNNCNAIIETTTNTLITGCITTIIPNSVTSIGDDAFQYCSRLTNVTIGNSVTSIGNYAFYGCSSLTSITVEAITPPSIQKETFNNFEKPTLYVPGSALGAYKAHQYWRQFKNIQAIQDAGIPNNEIWYTSSDGKVVTPYDSNVFGANIVSNTYTNGKGIIKFDGNVTSIGNSAFDGCSGLTSVTIPNSVTSIGIWAFYYCSGLTSVTIGNSVTEIGYMAFYGCSGLTSVTIPNSVTSIGESAISNCSGLTSMIVESGNTVYDSRNNCNAIIETKSNTLISGCKNTTIPNSVTSIGNYAFYHCSGLTSVTIPNSVTSIGEWAFGYCDDLTSVTIPNSVTSIGNYAFYHCSGLTSVTIPNSVTSIGNYTFGGCSGLTSVTIPNSVTEIINSAFGDCSGLTSMVVESGNKVYDSRGNCNAIIETASNTLISGCKNTTIPNSVTSIGDFAFYGCSGLTSVTIGNSVTSIGKSAFYSCKGLTSVTIGNSVTSIGIWAFYYCSGLTSVTIGNSVTSIGSFAFAYCSGLTSVTIPNSVTSIGEQAFRNCSGLTSITVEAVTPPSIQKETFNSYEKPTLYVPASALGAYKAHQYWGQFKKIQAIQGGDPSGTAHSWRVSNRTDIAVDFASINAADASSLVADGDTLYLERGTSLTTEQTFKKRLVIVGPGYKYDKTGQDACVRNLYAYGEGSEIIGVNVTGYLFADANNLTISHCYLNDVIGYKTSYENEKCVIHSCFIDGVIEGDGEDNTDAWVLTNNIFAEGYVIDLDNAVLDHNTFVVSNADFCLNGVTNSVVKNNILFHKRGNNPLLNCTGNTYEKNIFSMDQKLDNNKWNETLEKIISCTGEPSQEAYYQTGNNSVAYHYSTDGSDCGAFGGKEPYVMHGYTDLYVESEGGGGGDDPGFQIEPNDLLALKNLYNRYGGSKWYSGWTFKDKGVEAEDFPGVVFTTNTDSYGYHYVQEINLSKNNLSGDVSSWALSFPRLTSLNLSSNNLTGDLTGFVAELSNLKTLNVGYNMLTGLTSLPKSVATLYKDHQMANQYNTEYYANLTPVQVLISDEAVKTVLPTIFTYNLKSNSTEPVATEMLYEAGNSGNFGRIEPTGNGYKTTWTSIPYFYEEEQDRSICLRSNDGSLYPAILSYVNGDADMSGFTNVLDVQNTINYILNPALLERFNSSAANTYSDKMVNVQDIVCTVNIILGLPNSPSARMKMSGYDLSSTANSLYTQGERVWLNVDSETAALDVVLKGVSTDEVSLMLNHNDFQMIARNTEEGSRYVIYSLTGKTIPVGTTAILRTSCDEAEPTDALLSTIDAKSIPVAVGMSPTGIAKVNTDNAIVRIYTIKGMEVYNNPVAISDSQLNEVKKNLENGIYIVDKQMKNGSHKKYKYLKQ